MGLLATRKMEPGVALTSKGRGVQRGRVPRREEARPGLSGELLWKELGAAEGTVAATRPQGGHPRGREWHGREVWMPILLRSG